MVGIWATCLRGRSEGSGRLGAAVGSVSPREWAVCTRCKGSACDPVWDVIRRRSAPEFERGQALPSRDARTHSHTHGLHRAHPQHQPLGRPHIPGPLHPLSRQSDCQWRRGGGGKTTRWVGGKGEWAVHVVWRCEILVWGGRRVGQEGVRDMGTQERHQTGGGATQTHRTREPHQEGQGRAQQTRRRGTARRERQLEQREQRTRMEGMAERAHGRQRQ